MGLEKMQGTPAFLEYIGERGGVKNHSCRGCINYVDGVCLVRNSIISGYSDDNAKRCKDYKSRYVDKPINASKVMIKSSKQSEASHYNRRSEWREKPILKEKTKKKKQEIIRKKDNKIDVVEIVSNRLMKCPKDRENLEEIIAELQIYTIIEHNKAGVINTEALMCTRCNHIYFTFNQYSEAKRKCYRKSLKVIKRKIKRRVEWEITN